MTLNPLKWPRWGKTLGVIGLVVLGFGGWFWAGSKSEKDEIAALKAPVTVSGIEDSKELGTALARGARKGLEPDFDKLWNATNSALLKGDATHRQLQSVAGDVKDLKEKKLDMKVIEEAVENYFKANPVKVPQGVPMTEAEKKTFVAEIVSEAVNRVKAEFRGAAAAQERPPTTGQQAQQKEPPQAAPQRTVREVPIVKQSPPSAAPTEPVPSRTAEQEKPWSDWKNCKEDCRILYMRELCDVAPADDEISAEEKKKLMRVKTVALFEAVVQSNCERTRKFFERTAAQATLWEPKAPVMATQPPGGHSGPAQGDVGKAPRECKNGKRWEGPLYGCI